MWQLITDNLPMLMEGSGETLVMTFVSALFACWAGLSTSAGPFPSSS